ncbi:hypothetical protein CAter282_1457 [Collimonas arenae]|uniref:YdhG-like domain-containing protein n=1 Tax=Collimonas arenae TaxID=279058 RepID=A0A127PNJ5_9BURK|nr:DUF1801 domain-containing protein [Collimonas arenae]AMO99342.1 hypothetical protein CAter10_1576 [Collimonas arenae]AMP09246.1 hypothetical protein CAter282_1457 [Collimonas arenae]
MKPIKNANVAKIFDGYPPRVRRKLLVLRQLILDTAAGTAGVGEIEEILKWGEPAYLTTKSKSGSTIRVGWKKSNPSQYAMYFNCQTSLIETFRTLFPDDFRFVGNRSIVFEEGDVLPVGALEFCIAAALTYHLDKMKKGHGSSWTGNSVVEYERQASSISKGKR